jgi:glycosyltransferase involved in cell wall biosynthesis
LCSDHSGQFAVLIAAYNASKTIESVITETRRFWPGAVVVVDDGSRDGTGAAAEELADVVLRHEANRGKGAALVTGLTYLRENGYNVAITLDADGQHPPELIPGFVAKYQETACDLVVGCRPFALRRMPLLRLLGNRLSSFWVSVAASPTANVAFDSMTCGQFRSRS